MLEYEDTCRQTLTFEIHIHDTIITRLNRCHAIQMEKMFLQSVCHHLNYQKKILTVAAATCILYDVQ